MTAPAMTFDEYVVAQGLVFRAEVSFSGVAAADAAFTGITTGADEVVILQRAYGSSENTLTIELFEASFTAGTDARVLNRRFTSAELVPGTIKQGVTPGTLGNAISGVTLRSGSTTGSSSLQISGDESRLYLKPNTSYVVRYTNGGSNPATIGNSFDFRKALKGEGWDKNIPSA